MSNFLTCKLKLSKWGNFILFIRDLNQIFMKNNQYSDGMCLDKVR